MSIEGRHLSFQRDRQRVLQDVTFDVDEGEAVVIVGSTGSGKSTLAAILAGLRRPSSGQVCVEGKDIWGRGGADVRRRVGLVMQQAEDQFVGKTVFDDVAFGPRQRREADDVVEQRVVEALNATGFDANDVRDRHPHEFSGGQRKRLALAAILALQPRNLVLDEPFAGLDLRARQELVELLCTLRDRNGMSLLLLTSDLEGFPGMARMGLLLRGHIQLTGDMADFIANQRLLKESGLSLPEPIQLALALRELGWNVPVLPVNDSLERAIVRERDKRAHA